MLTLIRPNGTVKAELFSSPKFLRNAEGLSQHTFAFVDGHSGRIFVGLFGGDSIHSFDYEGRRRASALIGPQVADSRLDRMLTRNKGVLRNPDGSWFHHGGRMLINVVALSDKRVALQIAEYDSRLGTDPLEGGTIKILRESGRSLLPVVNAEMGWGLMGRDETARPLFLKYNQPDSYDDYVVGIAN